MKTTRKNTFVTKPIVISLGGSILHHNYFDISVLDKLIYALKETSSPILLVIGGGKIARKIIKDIKNTVHEDTWRDRFGIAATRFNASLAIEYLLYKGYDVCPLVKRTMTSCDFSSYRIYVMGGAKPGMTTDTDAAIMAAKMKVKHVFNITDVKGVYTHFGTKQQRLLRHMSWKKFMDMFPAYSPGMHAPFDPIAAGVCAKHDIEVKITCIDDFVHALRSKQVGTLISHSDR